MAFDLSAACPSSKRSVPAGYSVGLLGDAESLDAVTVVQNAVWTDEKLDWLAGRSRANAPGPSPR